MQGEGTKCSGRCFRQLWHQFRTLLPFLTNQKVFSCWLFTANKLNSQPSTLTKHAATPVKGYGAQSKLRFQSSTVILKAWPLQHTKFIHSLKFSNASQNRTARVVSSPEGKTKACCPHLLTLLFLSTPSNAILGLNQFH